MSTKIIDRGWNEILRDVKSLNNAYSKVGFPSNATLNSTALEKYSGISEVASVAMFQEFGTRQEATPAQAKYLRSQGFPINQGTIITNPPRPFMSTSFDENKGKIIKMQEKIYKAVLDQKITPKQGLELLGEYGIKLIVKKIKEIVTPALHPFTIERRKGKSTKPLIDSGQMLQSVTRTEVMS